MQKFLAASERFHGRRILAIRFDNAGEHETTARYATSIGIKVMSTPAYRPSLNGIAERVNRTLAGKYLPLLFTSKLPSRFWGEALRMANLLRNCSPCSTFPDNATPYERWYGRAPDMSKHRIFGCTAWAHVPKEGRNGKLDTRSVQCVNLGYQEEHRQYRLFEPVSRRIVLSRDVKFDEVSFLNIDPDSPASVPHSAVAVTQSTTASMAYSLNKSDLARQGNREALKAFLTLTDIPDVIADDERDALDTIGDPRSAARLANKAVIEAAIFQDDPQSYKQAMASPFAAEWRRAIDEELDTLVKMGTWDAAPKITRDSKPIGSRLVFKTKYGPGRVVLRRKARLVAKGYTQKAGVDFDDTFAPVARMVSTKLLCALAALSGSELHALDYDAAFLNSLLSHLIWMVLPEGCGALSGLVVLLVRSIYGLRQACREWWINLNSGLISQGWTPVPSDPCVYTHRKTNSVIAIHVDDVLLLVKVEHVGIKAGIMGLFKCKDLGLCTSYLGCEVLQANGSVTVTGTKMIEEILSRFNLEDCNPVATPMLDRITKEDCPTEGSQDQRNMKQQPFRQIVGCISYLMLACRPDLAYVVTSLAKVQSNPGVIHLQAAKRVLRYLSGSRSLGVQYKSNGNTDILAFADADWAGNRDSRRSTTGYIFMLASGPISWNCRLQQTVALSSTEAEYMSIGDAVRECIWLYRIFTEITAPRLLVPPLLQVRNDNKGAIELTKNPTSHSRTKHVDIRHHFIRQYVETKRVIVTHVPTKEMLADILTKPLPTAIFLNIRRLIGMI